MKFADRFALYIAAAFIIIAANVFDGGLTCARF